VVDIRWHLSPEFTFGDIYGGPNAQAQIRYATAFDWQPRKRATDDEPAAQP
jgi:hypothetical protein